jgi:hypothetical protein
LPADKGLFTHPAWAIPEKDHSHYGPDVQIALTAFRGAWASYISMTKYDFGDDSQNMRTTAMQELWNSIARARKAETGTGFYLNQKEYKNVNDR